MGAVGLIHCLEEQQEYQNPYRSLYVLHAFQKKSKRGIATPKKEIDQIKRRLRRAEELAKQEEKHGRRH